MKYTDKRSENQVEKHPGWWKGYLPESVTIFLLKNLLTLRDQNTIFYP